MGFSKTGQILVNRRMLAKLQLEADNLQHLEAPLLMTLAWQTLGGPQRVFSRTFLAIVMVARVVML